MSAAIQTGFNTVLRNPYTLLSQEFTLNNCRAVITHFQDNFLFDESVLIWIKIIEIFQIGI